MGAVFVLQSEKIRASKAELVVILRRAKNHNESDAEALAGTQAFFNKLSSEASSLQFRTIATGASPTPVEFDINPAMVTSLNAIWPTIIPSISAIKDRRRR
jgi:hypothetical protein